MKLRRLMLVSGAILVVSTPGAAIAAFQHSNGAWTHGVDGRHVWMTRDDGGHHGTGVVAWITYSGWPWQEHSSEVRYAAYHVHTDGCEGAICRTHAGHFSSPGPYLGHHQHNN